MLEAVLLDIDDLRIHSKCDFSIPYITELINNLNEKKVKLAVVLNYPQEVIPFLTEKTGMVEYFNEILSEDEVKNSKPAPDILNLALQKLQVNKENSLVISNTTNGTIAAERAGIPCIGLLQANSDQQDLSRAFVLIESFKDIDTRFLTNEYRRAHGLPVEITSTEHLYIREMTVEDIKELYKIYDNPEVTRYTQQLDQSLSVELEKHKAYMKNIYSFYGYGLWGIYLKETNKLIGRAGIQNRMIDQHLEVELGYVLSQEYWGKGYGLECCQAILDYSFEYLGMERIVASIDQDNIRSSLLARKLGFQLEKQIIDLEHRCNLYSISEEIFRKQLKKNRKHFLATKQVAEKFKNGIDTQVYTKRYQYKNK